MKKDQENHGNHENPELEVDSKISINWPNRLAKVLDTELIDESTISVSLTPIGNFQYLYVRDINSKEVMVGISEKPMRRIYCHYVIYAERKDIDKLEVEI